MLVILQSELISADSYEGGGRGAFLSSSWSSWATHSINSHSCAELLISDENALMKIAPYSLHSFKSGMTSDGAAHGTLCVCTCVSVFLYMSLFPLPVIWHKAMCMCVTSLSGLNEFHSFIIVLLSYVSRAFWLGFVSKSSLFYLYIFLFSIFPVQISKHFSI